MPFEHEVTAAQVLDDLQALAPPGADARPLHRVAGPPLAARFGGTYIPSAVGTRLDL